MANYCISDIHGHYDYYKKMLEKIGFSDDDMLYIIGDVVDRGPHPVKLLLDLMKRPIVCCIAGNLMLKKMKYVYNVVKKQPVVAIQVAFLCILTKNKKFPQTVQKQLTNKK